MNWAEWCLGRTFLIKLSHEKLSIVVGKRDNRGESRNSWQIVNLLVYHCIVFPTPCFNSIIKFEQEYHSRPLFNLTIWRSLLLLFSRLARLLPIWMILLLITNDRSGTWTGVLSIPRTLNNSWLLVQTFFSNRQIEDWTVLWEIDSVKPPKILEIYLDACFCSMKWTYYKKNITSRFSSKSYSCEIAKHIDPMIVISDRYRRNNFLVPFWLIEQFYKCATPTYC